MRAREAELNTTMANLQGELLEAQDSFDQFLSVVQGVARERMELFLVGRRSTLAQLEAEFDKAEHEHAALKALSVEIEHTLQTMVASQASLLAQENETKEDRQKHIIVRSQVEEVDAQRQLTETQTRVAQLEEEVQVIRRNSGQIRGEQSALVMTLENLEQELAQEELLLLDLDWRSGVEAAQAKVVRLSRLVTRGNQEIEELRHQAAQLHLEFVSERDVVAQMERDLRSERSREEEYRLNDARMREELRSEWDSVAHVKGNITAAHGLLEELKLSVSRTKQQLQVEEIHARMEEHAQEQSASEAACQAREAAAKVELHAEQAKVRRVEDMLKAETEEGEIAKLQDETLGRDR